MSRSALPLVTGAAGFAGSHLVERLLASHARVAAWGHRSIPPSTDPRVEWAAVDLLDLPAVIAAFARTRPALVYHCAGLPHVAESWGSAERALQVNAIGTHHLLTAVQQMDPACRVVVVGSALVYRWSQRALREEDPLGPANPYGVSKLAQEMLGLRAATPVVVARPFNHAGCRQQASFVTSSFAKQIAEIEAGLAGPRLLVGNLDAARDIADVRDTVRGYEALAAHGRAGLVYNVCTGRAHRIGDLLEMMLGRARTKIEVVQDPLRLRPSDNPVVLGDPSRIQGETGWRAEIPIEQTLGDLLAWWRTQAGHRVS